MVFPVPPPWGCSSLLSHSPFVRKKQGLGFFFPFYFSFFFSLEENSIVLFLVVTTWLLATTLFCSQLCRQARGDVCGSRCPAMPRLQLGCGVLAGEGSHRLHPTRRLRLCTSILGGGRHSRAVPRGHSPAIRSTPSRRDERMPDTSCCGPARPPRGSDSFF